MSPSCLSKMSMPHTTVTIRNLQYTHRQPTTPRRSRATNREPARDWSIYKICEVVAGRGKVPRQADATIPRQEASGAMRRAAHALQHNAQLRPYGNRCRIKPGYPRIWGRQPQERSSHRGCCVFTEKRCTPEVLLGVFQQRMTARTFFRHLIGRSARLLDPWRAQVGDCTTWSRCPVIVLIWSERIETRFPMRAPIGHTVHRRWLSLHLRSTNRCASVDAQAIRSSEQVLESHSILYTLNCRS